MKNKILIFIVALSFCYCASANDKDAEKTISASKDKTNLLHANGFNYVSLGLEIGTTLNWFANGYPVHYGLPFKLYLGRRKKGRFIIRSGIHYFPIPSNDLSPNIRNINTTIIPMAIGYRGNIHNWYIEGSAGAAANMFTRNYTDSGISPTKITYREINYGLEVGRQIGDLDLGIVIYNTGPIPYNMLYAGFKGSYRIKW